MLLFKDLRHQYGLSTVEVFVDLTLPVDSSIHIHVHVHCQGMTYLHGSAIGYHGRLKSSNVLVDTRWTCQIGDFGMRVLREGETLSGHDQAIFNRGCGQGQRGPCGVWWGKMGLGLRG